jgi:hypothetical protein
MSQFPNLLQLEEQSGIKDDDIIIYCDHLDILHKDMSERFEDLLNMEIHDWVINPFLENIEVCNDVVEEELTWSKHDIEIKPMYKRSYQKLRLHKEICVRYPALWTIVKSLIVSFPTSYLVERCFSVGMKMLSQRIGSTLLNVVI